MLLTSLYETHLQPCYILKNWSSGRHVRIDDEMNEVHPRVTGLTVNATEGKWGRGRAKLSPKISFNLYATIVLKLICFLCVFLRPWKQYCSTNFVLKIMQSSIRLQKRFCILVIFGHNGVVLLLLPNCKDSHSLRVVRLKRFIRSVVGSLL